MWSIQKISHFKSGEDLKTPNGGSTCGELSWNKKELRNNQIGE